MLSVWKQCFQTFYIQICQISNCFFGNFLNKIFELQSMNFFSIFLNIKFFPRNVYQFTVAQPVYESFCSMVPEPWLFFFLSLLIFCELKMVITFLSHVFSFLRLFMKLDSFLMFIFHLYLFIHWVVSLCLLPFYLY